MSLFDKINESLSESDDNTQKNNQDYNNLNKVNDINHYIQENNQLKRQLLEANKINKENTYEIQELKNLLNNYNSQINNLKNSYEENVKNLKAQIDFEQEINEKYLSKLIQSNNELNNNIKDYNETSHEDNNKIISLLDNQGNSENNITSEDLDKLRSIISENNDDIKQIVSEIKDDNLTSNQDLLKEFNSYENNISELITDHTKDNVIELLNDNFNRVNKNLSETSQNHDSNYNNIINEIKSIDLNQDSSDIDEIKSLFEANNKELNNSTNKILDKLVNLTDIKEEFIEKITDSINKSDNNIEFNSEDKVKIEIFNKISDDLKKDNYINFNAYQQIKELNLFDEVFYKEHYNFNLDIDPLLHFIYKGYEENKNPSKNFNTLQYKQSQDKINESSLNPLVYFITTGIHEGNIKINDEVDEIKHIDKYDVDSEIENFSLRGVKKSKRKPRLIVSLTTLPEHINEVHYTLYSLLNQQVKADKVILWLNDEEYPNKELDLPKHLLRLKQNGLSIRFCENYNEYTKIIPTLINYPNDIIITADDNIFYPNNWLKQFYEDYKRNPNTIIAQKSKNITFDENNQPEKYEKWENNTDTKPVYTNFPLSEAGVLYPPNSIQFNLEKEEHIKTSDNVDVWLWTKALLNHTKIKLSEKHIESLTYVNPIRKTNILKSNNSEQSINKLEENLKNNISNYPEIINIITEN